MKHGKLLRIIRRSLAILLGAIILVLFLDITRALPSWPYRLADWQIVPMIISVAAAGLAVATVLTLLLGRWYCSVLCPLGILQDVVGRIKTWFYRARNNRRALRMKYRRPFNIVRYGVLAAVAVPYGLGMTLPLLATDPYSNFGRIAAALFRPVAVGINNLVAKAFNAAGNYSVYVVGNLDMGGAATVFAAVVLAALIIMSWRRGRLWCNTVCPVGTLLGVLSRFSIFRIRINEKCTHCTLCETSCKAQCIDSKSATVDASRCVACFNCLEKCKFDAMSYSFGTPWEKTVKPAGKPAAAVCADAGDASRRRFLKGSLSLLAALPAVKMLAAAEETASEPAAAGTKRVILPMPPGAGDRERFMQKCTACQLCVSVCPTKVLQPAYLENGIKGIMQPYLRFRLDSFCNFECRECSVVCPTNAIQTLTLEEKKLVRIGMAVFKRNDCIVYTEHQDCGACAEHCPTQAVHMVPFEDGLTIPRVSGRYCIGCGACESICPAKPLAITVRGLDKQNVASPPKADDFQPGEITDFGF